jgi:hypothetical protein
MKIECECGNLIPDNSDGLPCKAYLVPDQEWFDIWDAIDAAIERKWRDDEDRETVCMSLRDKVRKVSRQAWQCNACGRIHMDDRELKLQTFRPESADAPREIFRSRSFSG